MEISAKTLHFIEEHKEEDVCRLNDGKLLWANSTGLLYFEPRTLKESSSNRQFHISDIDINYNKVEIGEKIRH